MQPAYSDENIGRMYVSAGAGVSISNKVNYLLDDSVPLAKGEARSKKFDSGAAFYGGLGVIISPVFRFELDGVYFGKFKMKTAYVAEDTNGDLIKVKMKHHVHSSAAMLNMYCTPIIYKKFNAYISAGVGAAFHKSGNVVHVDFPNVSLANGKSVAKFAWSVGAGCSYNISDRWIFDFISYKFYDLNKFSTHAPAAGGGEPCSARIKVHSITAGIRMRI